MLCLKVDVIDAEYTNLVTQLRATNSFRSAYSLHRTFLATVARLAMVDNAIVQDAIERVIQVKSGHPLRFKIIYLFSTLSLAGESCYRA